MAIDAAALGCLVLAIEQSDPDSLLDEKSKRKRRQQWWGPPVDVLRSGTQAIVDEIQRSEPDVERVHDMAGYVRVGDGMWWSHAVVCTDRRVVVARANTGDGLVLFRSLPLGSVAVEPTMTTGFDLVTGADGRSVLRWPRSVEGSPKDLAASAASVSSVPSKHLASLQERLAHRPPATVAGRWHADPTGRHELRWWDGAQWTEHVSTGGAAAIDPL